VSLVVVSAASVNILGAASQMPRGHEAVPDTIGLVEVRLVGCSSTEGLVRHLGVVLVDGEIGQLLELREAFE